MRISDAITAYILDMLQENGSAELQRNVLAEELGCVPSQINYVLSSRFTPEQGYVVESRRGGGGYIFKNESSYSIIFGVYSKSDVAQTEAQQLTDAFTPSVITVSLDGIKIKITGQKAQLDTVQGASELLYKIAHTLESTSNLAQDISLQDAEAELSALKTNVSLHKSALKGLNSANESIVSMLEMLSIAEELLEELPSSNQSTFLSQLKYSAAKYICEYYGFYNSL